MPLLRRPLQACRLRSSIGPDPGLTVAAVENARVNQAYAAGLPDAVLVVGPSWVGDMVMAQSLFKALRRQHPDTAIDVLAPGWSLPLLERVAV